MILFISPSAKANATAKAQEMGHASVEVHIRWLLEKVFKTGSAYVIFDPAPAPERMNAVAACVQQIIRAPGFYGFKLLSKEEAEEELKKLTIDQEVIHHSV